MSTRSEVNASFARIAQFEADRNVAGLIGELQSDVRGRTDSTIIRAQAARVLGRLGDSRAIPHLVEFAGDPESNVRMEVLGALGKLKARGSLNVVVDGLKDESVVVRGSAAQALGRIGDQTAIGPLRTVLDVDADPEVRLHAAESLGVLGDTDVASRIPDVLKEVSWRVRRRPRWRRLQDFAENGGRLEAWYYPWD